MHPIYRDDMPANLEAAALDALEWLRWLARYLPHSEIERKIGTDTSMARLNGAIAALEQYVAVESAEFIDSTPTEIDAGLDALRAAPDTAPVASLQAGGDVVK